MRFTLLGTLAVFLAAFAAPAHAATISPDSDTNGMFSVMPQRDWTAGADLRGDAFLAVQASYFEFRESQRTLLPETPFAPQMPDVAAAPAAALTQEDTLRLSKRR